MMRGRGQKHRYIQLGRQALQAGNVVGVLMGDQNRRDFFHAPVTTITITIIITITEGLQALEGLAAGKTGIHQNAR
jgi:hypothetical protein